MKSVLILGAGFAGLELATVLSDEVPDEVDVTIVDSSDAFVFGFSKLDLMFGRKDLAGVWPMVRHYFFFGRKPAQTGVYNRQSDSCGRRS